MKGQADASVNKLQWICDRYPYPLSSHAMHRPSRFIRRRWTMAAPSSLAFRSTVADSDCRCSKQLSLIKLDKRAAKAVPILGTPVEQI
jgi:hypothetical protein